MRNYCIYLRKSRADREAEMRGEGETLARHRAMLLDHAKRLQLSIGAIYEEIVSGDSIAARPVMQQLLSEVEQGVWAGVLVVEVERLARGDTIDQGLVAQAFKYSNTLIITPLKTYDPNNEFDEEYFEFGLFMSRREYKTIKRRLQNGTTAAVKEGKYARSVAPYGYERVKLKKDKGYSLEPLAGEAEVVQMIFTWFTVGIKEADGTYSRLGTALISRKLNEMHIKPRRSDCWTPATIRDILKNEHYIGKVVLGKRKRAKVSLGGQIKESCVRPKEYEVYDGLHPALVTEETFYRARDILSQNKPRGRVEVTTNPIAGIVICGKCGRRMVRRPYANRLQAATLMCPATACKNVSCRCDYVEQAILDGLKTWAEQYSVTTAADDCDYSELLNSKKQLLARRFKDLEDVKAQIDNIYLLLEKGVYSTEIFLSRQKLAASQQEEIESSISELQDDIRREEELLRHRTQIVPKIYNLLDCYYALPDAGTKNAMLKEVLDKVIYLKSSNGNFKNQRDNDFQIDIFPKLPKKEQV